MNQNQTQELEREKIFEIFLVMDKINRETDALNRSFIDLLDLKISQEKNG